jgi:hypothetical protein
VLILSRGSSANGIRNLFMNNFYDADNVVSSYLEWLVQFFYAVFYRFVDGDFEYIVLHGLKRGDDRYSYRVCKKFNKLSSFGEDLVYFKYGTRNYVKSGALLVTLEYDSNKTNLSDAWLNVGVDFNRFMSRSIVRVWESHESAYPHIHCLLIFHEFVFDGRFMHKRRGRGSCYRVYGDNYQDLKSGWSHGFSDFEMVHSYHGGIRYLSKYLGKSTSAKKAGSKGVKTLAMCWVFGKRSFGFSGDLFHKTRL